MLLLFSDTILLSKKMILKIVYFKTETDVFPMRIYSIVYEFHSHELHGFALIAINNHLLRAINNQLFCINFGKLKK